MIQGDPSECANSQVAVQVAVQIDAAKRLKWSIVRLDVVLLNKCFCHSNGSLANRSLRLPWVVGGNEDAMTKVVPWKLPGVCAAWTR